MKLSDKEKFLVLYTWINCNFQDDTSQQRFDLIRKMATYLCPMLKIKEEVILLEKIGEILDEINDINTSFANKTY